MQTTLRCGPTCHARRQRLQLLPQLTLQYHCVRSWPARLLLRQASDRAGSVAPSHRGRDTPAPVSFCWRDGCCSHGLKFDHATVTGRAATLALRRTPFPRCTANCLTRLPGPSQLRAAAIDVHDI
jgi:hypothetical protein